MTDSDSPYFVLARKYRPQSFTSLIGQEAMVQTLANAFKANRIHHAYILTGVRGVGKTTTARILARAFNYSNENGAHPSLDLEKEGEHCRAIIEGRHVDVIEMDAASNTGIDNIREIIDSIRYGPVSAPYKVYIIDEVHMLSTAAFNGLLKTLEEPPAHVKFIFATTEIRKVPITILSRCQRFDLRRINAKTMSNYLNEILQKEKIAVEQVALDMIIRAGEGSVRDCLSLLDQAIAYGEGKITASNIETMLGLADRSKIIDLFELIMAGEIALALDLVRELYDSGCEPQVIIADLADLCHLITRFRIVPLASNDISLTPDERERVPILASKLSMQVLTRAWQVLSFGLDEIAKSNMQIQAAEMVIIRLAHISDLPTPDELIKKIEKRANSAQVSAKESSPTSYHGGNLSIAQQSVPISAQNIEVSSNPKTYSELVALARENRDLALKHALENDLRLINFEVGHIEVSLSDNVNPSIIATLSGQLKKWTGRNWLITVSNETVNAPSLREIESKKHQQQLDIAMQDELVQAIIATFPEAKLVNVKIKQTKNNNKSKLDRK